MRLRIYIDGKPDWRDIGEGYARIPSHHGELVRGEPRVEAKRQRGRAVDKSLTDFADNPLPRRDETSENRGVQASSPEVSAVSVTP